MFSMVEIKPDIAFSVAVAACFIKNPSHAYIEAIKTILCSFRGSMDCSIIYGVDEEDLFIIGYLNFY